MKKTLILLFGIILLITRVSADNNKDISRIEYKWYKEEKIEELFYPKKDNLSGYLEDENKIKYGNYSKWDNQYCENPKEYYQIEEKTIYKYEELLKTKYIKLESLYNIGTSDDFKTIKIFYENSELNYTIIQKDTYLITIELEKEYETDKIKLYIDTDVRYFVYLFNDSEFNKQIVSYSVIPRHDGKELIWNEKWISQKSTYEEKTSENKINDSKSIKNIIEERICRVREIKTYRYKTKREYYDDKYHIFIEGYLPDIQNSVIYYNDNSKKEITKQPTNQQNDTTINSLEKETKELILKEEVDNRILKNNEKIIYKTEYVDKIISKIPLKIYLILIILIIIIVFETIKIISKKVD